MIASSTMIAATLIATTSAGTISFEYKLFEFLIGDGVWGTRLGSDVPKHSTNKTRPPNARSSAVWGTQLETL
jgi:hypothetical protein